MASQAYHLQALLYTLALHRHLARRVASYAYETHFGGVFYLLNAALALGIYADFTAPRGPNLELSPWDWLALIGREWFGEEFVEDPVWTALAELAGRTPFENPERDFQPPSAGWLPEHLAMLRARLAAAVGAGEGIDVPAFVCRHPAGIEVTATAVHVFLSLAGLDLAIRIAGLDRSCPNHAVRRSSSIGRLVRLPNVNGSRHIGANFISWPACHMPPGRAADSLSTRPGSPGGKLSKASEGQITSRPTRLSRPMSVRNSGPPQSVTTSVTSDNRSASRKSATMSTIPRSVRSASGSIGTRCPPSGSVGNR